MTTNTAADRLQAVASTLSQVAGNRVARFPVNPTQPAYKTLEDGTFTTHTGRVLFTPPKVDLTKKLKKVGG